MLCACIERVRLGFRERGRRHHYSSLLGKRSDRRQGLDLLPRIGRPPVVRAEGLLQEHGSVSRQVAGFSELTLAPKVVDRFVEGLNSPLVIGRELTRSLRLGGRRRLGRGKRDQADQGGQDCDRPVTANRP